MERESVRRYALWYYHGVRFFFVFSVFTSLFFKNAYRINENTLVLLLSLYLGVASILAFREDYLDGVHPGRFYRFLDYAVVLAVVFYASNLAGAIPTAVPLVAYSALFAELATVSSAVMLLSLFNTFYLQTFPLSDFLVFIAFFWGILLSASRLNLMLKVWEQIKKIRRFKKLGSSYQKQIALLSDRLKVYEEFENLLEKVSRVTKREDFLKILLEELSIEDLAVYGPSRTVRPREGYLIFSSGRLRILLKPKHKFLLNDPYYRAKVETALRLLRPYLESFFAKSR